jgi:pimeloyl-ACP methyl ester carboxylesterase
MSAVVRTFQFEGSRLAYAVHGSGPRPLVLTHALLLSRKMQAPLADALTAAGHRVICPDLLGHGASDRPTPTENYSVRSFGAQILALLDHLELDKAVIGGTSLGANVSLEVAARAPERVRGLVIEMPVLDNALLATAMTFTPLCMVLGGAPGLVRALTFPWRRVPPQWTRGRAEVLLDLMCLDPEADARVLRGLLFGQTAPDHGQRAAIAAPTLVIGHPRDPIHPFSDSDMLVRELTDARLLRASSILELRLRPRRLTLEIARFLDQCWERRTSNRRTA